MNHDETRTSAPPSGEGGKGKEHLMQPHFTPDRPYLRPGPCPHPGCTAGPGPYHPERTVRSLPYGCNHHVPLPGPSGGIRLPGKGKGSGMPQILSDMPHRRWCRRGPQYARCWRWWMRLYGTDWIRMRWKHSAHYGKNMQKPGGMRF